MSSQEQGSINTLSQQTTHVRPFAPDDFRRERRPIVEPISTIPRSFSSRALPVSQSILNSIHHNSDANGSQSLQHGRSISAFDSADHETSSKREQQTPMSEWQHEAEKEWQTLRERRRSVALPPSHQTSLAKSAILAKPSSPTSEEQQTLFHQDRDRSRRRSETFFASHQRSRSHTAITPWTASSSIIPAPSPQSALTLAKERDANAMHRALETLIQREKAGPNASPRPSRSSFDALQRAKSIMSISSSKMSGESTKELLSDSNGEDASRVYSDGAMHSRSDSRRRYSRRPQSMLVSQSTGDAPRRPDSNNNLTSDEKMNQLKRSQKLATMLGGEWWREADSEWLSRTERESSSSPLKGVATKKISLLRRQSDPLHLQQMIQAKKEDAEYGKKLRSFQPEAERSGDSSRHTNTRWRTLHGKRSRSSINLRQDILYTSSAAIPLSPPPLDIHPKAAALLGLCVAPENKSSEVDPLHRVGTERCRDDYVAKNDDHRLSSSSIEFLKDSDSSAAGVVDDSKDCESDTSSRTASAGFETSILEDLDTDEESITVSREERRKRVKKISRWLGAVVPPHLIMPNPELHPSQQKATSGYNMDEAPPSPMTNYIDGSPIFPTDRQRVPGSPDILVNAAGNASKPLIKAKAVVHAKLGKKSHPEIQERGPQFSSPINKASLNNEKRLAKSTISEGERLAIVKRNHKLTAVFGERPPQGLFLTATHEGNKSGRMARRSSLSLPSVPSQECLQEKSRNRQFRSVSPNAFSPSPSDFLVDSIDQSRVDAEVASLDSHTDPLASDQYRTSVDSLEYLLKKDPPRLNDLVIAVQEDEKPFLESQEQSRSGACTPVGPSSTRASSATAPIEKAIKQQQMPLQNQHQNKRHSQLSCMSDSEASLTENSEENRERELRIRRHQKLGRWFGEAPPQAEIGNENNAHFTTDKTKLNTTKQRSSRMAPRSAGSAPRPHPIPQRALGEILNSIEAEMVENDDLSLMERQQLQNRLWRLRCDPSYTPLHE